MIGRDLGGRYEILERVGGGGMALVYKAHDMTLHRTVAIKVLRQQFVGDEQFIRRFQREAQSAASLSHPSVVSIYDVGQDEDTHYIVMEYIEGENLNEKIKNDGPLSPETAVDIAAQICDALAHAHARGIIHRDIKPHNILIGNNGMVKVTDFGIARAAASTDITQTGAVMGSVHYFSPEHAKGVPQGEQSDLYSLGIVLYQMLTNRLPFFGDSPISIALKHLHENFEDPRSVNPDIPQSIENIILRALRKNPEERYESAEQMLQDLQSCLLEHRKFEQKVIFTDDLDDQATKVMPAIRDDQEGPRDFELSEKDLKRDKLPGWVKPSIWSAVIILIFVLGFLGFRTLADMIIVPDVEVPDVIGKPLEVARQELLDVKLQVDTEFTTSDEVEENHVIDQSRKDISVKENSTIVLTVSEGPLLIELDSYVDESFEVIRERLLGLGVEDRNIIVEFEESEESQGLIMSHTPGEGAKINPTKDEIVFVVSEAIGTIPMPDLIGKTMSQVEAILMRDELELAEDGVESETSFTIPEGQVTRQLPAEPGEPIEPGTEVTVFISEGPPSNARFFTKSIEVSPRVQGESSTIDITYTDARGDDQDGGTLEIIETTTIAVEVVVTPNTNARITISVDGEFSDMETVTYRNVLEAEQDDENDAPADTEPEGDDENESDSGADDATEDDADSNEGSEEEQPEPTTDEPIDDNEQNEPADEEEQTEESQE